MSRDRVKFFSRTDMSAGFYLDRLRTVVDSIDPATHTVGSLDDALELFNITKFIDEELLSFYYRNPIKRFDIFLRKIIAERCVATATSARRRRDRADTSVTR